jgi:hypothetical protein
MALVLLVRVLDSAEDDFPERMLPAHRQTSSNGQSDFVRGLLERIAEV